MNYVFTDIESHRNEYPDANQPEIAQRFKSLDEYLIIARKVIKKFGREFMNASEVQKMLNSEDAISEIARHIMTADWRYKPGKGRTEYSYRNMCAKWAIQDYVGLFRTKANKTYRSLDTAIGDGDDSVSLSSITEDKLVKEPSSFIEDEERKERVKKYISFLIKNSKLTYVQEKCIYLKFIEDIESHKEIGKRFNPPITRQAVKQNIDRGLYKLKQTALGTGNNI